MIGQVQVQQDQIELQGKGQQRFLGRRHILGLNDGVAASDQIEDDDPPQRRFVLHDQNTRHQGASFWLGDAVTRQPSSSGNEPWAARADHAASPLSRRATLPNH
jgi:hypothetical protein